MNSKSDLKAEKTWFTDVDSLLEEFYTETVKLNADNWYPETNSQERFASFPQAQASLLFN